MVRPDRLALVFSSVALVAACGPPQPAQTGQETVVVVPPSDSAGAAPDGAAPEVLAPRKVGAGDVEECIAKLRDDVPMDDPAKTGGEADYHDALAAERAGKLDVARKGYFNVVSDHPESVFVPPSYFAFGEMFAVEAKKDGSKVIFAEQSYNEVLKFPASVNKLRAAALYRMGVVLAESQPPRALSVLARAAKADRELAQDGCAAEVSAAALAAAVPVYFEIGSPQKSWAFFVGLAGDAGRAAQTTLALAERYVAAKKPDDAAVCLAASVEAGAKGHPDAVTRAAYCARVKQVAGAVRAGAGATQAVAALDRALAAGCP